MAISASILPTQLKMPRTITSLMMLVASFLFPAHHALAGIIDFESTPTGGTPTDNAAFTGSYLVGATYVTFGYDTDLDLVADEGVFYELYGGTDPVSAYAGDGDSSGEGGSYFLRLPLRTGDSLTYLATGTQFLITYTGVLPTAASGSIWDLDSSEEFTVSAYDSAGALLDSQSFSSINHNNLPTDFAFSGLGEIGYIGVTSATGSPLGFDNFDATGGIVTTAPTPNPLLLILAGLGPMILKRKKG